jgi:ferredoxin
MSARVEANLLHDLKAYGAVGVEKCFNCGNCTAICPLSSADNPFPRNCVRLAQVWIPGCATTVANAQPPARAVPNRGKP